MYKPNIYYFKTKVNKLVWETLPNVLYCPDDVSSKIQSLHLPDITPNGDLHNLCLHEKLLEMWSVLRPFIEPCIQNIANLAGHAQPRQMIEHPSQSQQGIEPQSQSCMIEPPISCNMLTAAWPIIHFRASDAPFNRNPVAHFPKYKF